MQKILEFLKGKKTYIVAIFTAILSCWAALHGMNPDGIPVIPEWVWGILAAAGLGTIRSAITSASSPSTTTTTTTTITPK